MKGRDMTVMKFAGWCPECGCVMGEEDANACPRCGSGGAPLGERPENAKDPGIETARAIRAAYYRKDED